MCNSKSFHNAIQLTLTAVGNRVFLYPLCPQGEEAVTGPRESNSGVSVSFSSIDDVASVGPLSASSQGSVGPLSVSSLGSVGPPWAGAGAVGTRTSWSSGDTWQMTGKGGEEEERKDKLTEVPVCSAVMRPCIRSLSPFRRHSWGPGKNPEGETDVNQRR